MSDKRTCHVCGCTEDRACVIDGWLPCAWVSSDLCTACANIKQLTESPSGRQWLMAFAAGELFALCERAHQLTAGGELLLPNESQRQSPLFGP